MNTKVFVVISNSGSFDSYISQIEGIFSTEEKAKQNVDKDKPYIATTKIEWEE